MAIDHCLFLTGLIVSASIQPERWVPIGGGSGSDNEYLDTRSVTRSGDTTTVWTRRDFVPGQGTAWHEMQFDCVARTATILSYVRDDGTAITHNVTRPHRETAPIEPGSAEERAFALACR